MEQENIKKNFLKIVVIGDSNVGKTSLMCRFADDKAPLNLKPTVGADFKKKELFVNNTIVNAQIWDTAG